MEEALKGALYESSIIKHRLHVCCVLPSVLLEVERTARVPRAGPVPGLLDARSADVGVRLVGGVVVAVPVEV